MFETRPLFLTGLLSLLVIVIAAWTPTESALLKFALDPSTVHAMSEALASSNQGMGSKKIGVNLNDYTTYWFGLQKTKVVELGKYDEHSAFPQGTLRNEEKTVASLAWTTMRSFFLDASNVDRFMAAYTQPVCEALVASKSGTNDETPASLEKAKTEGNAFASILSRNGAEKTIAYITDRFKKINDSDSEAHDSYDQVFFHSDYGKFIVSRWRGDKTFNAIQYQKRYPKPLEAIASDAADSGIEEIPGDVLSGLSTSDQLFINIYFDRLLDFKRVLLNFDSSIQMQRKSYEQRGSHRFYYYDVHEQGDGVIAGVRARDRGAAGFLFRRCVDAYDAGKSCENVVSAWVKGINRFYDSYHTACTPR